MDDRQLLALLAAGPLPAHELAHRCGTSETAIAERIHELRDDGLAIERSPLGTYELRAVPQWLDAQIINQALTPQAAARLQQLDVAWEVGSTNSALLEQPAGAGGDVVLLAERQTSGRGRRGRAWQSPLGANVYLSVLHRVDGGLQRAGGLSLAMGVAVAEALHALGFTQVQLKWPNDLVVDGRKLGGLLVEGGGEFAGPAKVVIGLGLNVHMPVQTRTAITQPWIDLDGLGHSPVSRNAVAAQVVSMLLPALAQFDQHGLAPFLPRFAQMDALAGQYVRIERDGVMYEGYAQGVADDGALQVVINGAVVAFHAGEVSVRAI